MMTKVRKMGSFKKILSMLPGIPKELRDADIDEKQIDRINASIYTFDSNIRVKQPKELLENYIHEFCVMENVERSDLWLLGEESPLMEKLVAFLESKSIIRRIYRNPDSLRRTLSDILAPF